MTDERVAEALAHADVLAGPLDPQEAPIGATGEMLVILAAEVRRLEAKLSAAEAATIREDWAKRVRGA